MRLRRYLVLLLIFLFLCGCSADVQQDMPTPLPDFVPGKPAGTPFPHESVKIFTDGFLTDRGILYSGSIMLPALSVLEAFGVKASVKSEDNGFVLSADGLELRGSINREYMTANGRYLYAPGGYVLESGSLWLPCEVMAKILGVEINSSPELLRADINSTGMNLICGDEDYYALNINSEDLYWLSRIISSEAGNEPLAGMIGVGNVVMNRVASPDFPTTIFDVIFDREYGVQFEPIITGGIYDEPDELSVIAAYLCFEGFNTVGDSLYFVNPETGGSWFDEELQFVTAIGGHNFYSEEQVG